MNIEDLFGRKLEPEVETATETLRNEFPITRAVFIDSTWHQTKSIYKDQRLRGMSGKFNYFIIPIFIS